MGRATEVQTTKEIGKRSTHRTHTPTLGLPLLILHTSAVVCTSHSALIKTIRKKHRYSQMDGKTLSV